MYMGAGVRQLALETAVLGNPFLDGSTRGELAAKFNIYDRQQDAPEIPHLSGKEGIEFLKKNFPRLNRG